MAPEESEYHKNNEILTKKAKSTLAGALVILAFIAIGDYVNSTGSITDVDLWNSIFIGLGVGHYFGKALESKNLINYYLTGAFSIMSLYMFYQVGVSGLAMVMISLFLTVFLKHSSKLVENHDTIDNLVNIFAGKVAISYLVIVIGVANALPILEFITGAEVDLSFASNNTAG
jgi:hypothetical protein